MTPIIKWLVTTILVPIIQRMIGSWLSARDKAQQLKDKIKGNQVKQESYEKDPSDSSFSELP